MARPLLVLLLLAAAGCRHGSDGRPPERDPAPAPEETAAVPDVPAVASCAACHAEIAAEWSGSMHARSTLEKNPLYRRLYDLAVEAGVPAERACRACHYQDDWQAAQAAGRPVEGVSCGVCHAVSPRHPEPGPDGARARFARSHPGAPGAQGLCLSCHDTLRTPDGRPICTTGPEAARADGGACVDCHMRDGGGRTSHAFPGGHVPAFVAGAAEVDLAVHAGGIVAVVRPTGVGHALPTGNPLRHLILTVEARDAAGATLWRNVPQAGLPFDHPEALFMRVFSGPDGRRPVPPFLSAGPATELQLEGPREVRYPLPPGTRSLHARLDFFLAPAALLDAAGAPPDWPRRIPVAEATLEP